MVLPDAAERGGRSLPAQGCVTPRARGVRPGPRRRGSGSEAHAEICACVTRLAATLKPEYAEALRRIEIDGVAVRDFAEERGLSASNAAVRVFRARAALKKQVVASCGTCAEHGCLDCGCKTG